MRNNVNRQMRLRSRERDVHGRRLPNVSVMRTSDVIAYFRQTQLRRPESDCVFLLATPGSENERNSRVSVNILVQKKRKKKQITYYISI